MIQYEGFPIESPCQRKCETNKQGVCKTCFRSREERFNWLQYDNEMKAAVLSRCAARKSKARNAIKNRIAEQFEALRQASGICHPEQANLLDEYGGILHPQNQMNIFEHLPPLQTDDAKAKPPAQLQLPF